MERTKTTFKTYLHWGSIGDVWACMPGLREVYRKTGVKPILYLGSGFQGEYYEGATHPTRNEFGQQVLLNDKVIDMMIPFIKSQDYIEDCRKYNYEKIECDLTVFRTDFVNLPYGHISRWYFYVFPDMACDLSEKYFDVPDATDFYRDKIIVNRTERYRNEYIKYDFLRDYEKNILFVGTDEEHKQMQESFGLTLQRQHIDDFLKLARIIKSCKFYIGNQSQAFQIAEGLKVPRILETCHFAPNVIPTGKDAYDFYGTDALKYYVELLYNRK